jgi:hypothetical protein
MRATIDITLKSLTSKWLLFFAFCTLVTSCYGPRRVNKWVDEKYGATINSQIKARDDYFSISSNLVTNAQFASTTVKETKHVLPLLFYWRVDYVNTCALNPKIPVNDFSSTFRSYANSKGLKQKLNGAKIELSVDAIPNVFAINDRGRVVWVIYAIGWDVFNVLPENKDMVVSYRIVKDNAETKKGTVTISDMNKPIKNLTRVRDGTWQYLAQYDENIKSMTKKAVDKIMEEL